MAAPKHPATAAAKDADDMPPSRLNAEFERAATTQSNIISAAPSVGKALVVIVAAAISVGTLSAIVYQVKTTAERLETKVQALEIARATEDEHNRAIAATLAEIKAATSDTNSDIKGVRYDLGQLCSHIKDAHCLPPHQ